jgi:cytochrome c-550 PedF
MTAFTLKSACAALALSAVATLVQAHGDVAPQAVDTAGLPETGDDWLTENPYRAEAVGEEVWARAVEIGASGYNQNCARCHGLEAISGGLAPDVRFLEAEEYGDEWYIERFRFGYTQNGTTKMPEFGELLGQDAAWAIRTYIETRPDDQELAARQDELHTLKAQVDGLKDDASGAEAVAELLIDVGSSFEALSGAPKSVTALEEAALLLRSDPPRVKAASDALLGILRD